MTETIPFQDGMLLGRTYDLRHQTIGSDIFITDNTANPERYPCPSTKIDYKVIHNSSDVNDILDVTGEISLKVKAGILKVQGMGNYLKEIRSEENALEILAVAHVKTGGELIIKISYITSDSKQNEEIKAHVDGEFKLPGGALNAEGQAKLRKLEHDLRGKTHIKFSYYGTTQCTDLPRDMDSMLHALNDFPNQLIKINDGMGAPLRCEVVQLASIVPDFPTVMRDTSLETQMKEMGNNYDDIRQSHAMLLSCLEDDAEHISKEQEIKGKEIETRIHDVKWRFDKVIGLLDVTKDGDQIKDAVKFYRTNITRGINFRTEVKMFIKEVQQLKPTCAPVKDFPKGKPLSILLVGVTGHGKSATANSIFGEYKFNTHMGCESVWNRCQMEHGIIGGREVHVMDTPGSIYVDTAGLNITNHYDNELKELETAFVNQPFGYHALLFVLSIDVRSRYADVKAIKMLKKKFGHETLKKYGIIIFTHRDCFERNMKKHKQETSFEEHINSEKSLQENFLKEFNNRYALIDNLEQDPGRLREQVISIIELIDRLVEYNKGIPYKWTGGI